MNTENLKERLSAALQKVYFLAGDHLPEGPDDKPNQEMVRLMGALANVDVAIQGITETKMEAVEKRQQYLNMRQALKAFDKSEGALRLYAIEIGEFEGDEWKTPSDVYKVLVAGDDYHIACKDAEAFCVSSLERPEKALNILNIDEIETDEVPILRAQIW